MSIPPTRFPISLVKTAPCLCRCFVPPLTPRAAPNSFLFYPAPEWASLPLGGAPRDSLLAAHIYSLGILDSLESFSFLILPYPHPHPFLNAYRVEFFILIKQKIECNTPAPLGMTVRAAADYNLPYHATPLLTAELESIMVAMVMTRSMAALETIS